MTLVGDHCPLSCLLGSVLSMAIALGGTLSSYTWICMILNFLQTRNPPVLPCLHKRPHQKLVDSNGKLSSFADDVISLRGFGEKNKESLGELLFHFFRRFGHEIDYERNVISVREGRLISKEAKKWHLMQNNRLCVEEPFNTERNLGNTADDISFRGVHLELRRAFDLLCEAKLQECIEQYEFPLTEEKFWEKPPSRPMPVLSRSRSQSQSGRGKPGFGNRGNRNTSGQHRAGAGRRASSAAAMNKIAGPQIGVRGITSQDHPLQAHFQQLHLHDHLFNEYQHLQAQELELRARQAQAQAQLHTQNQSQCSSMSTPIPQQALREHFNRSAMMNQASFSAPLRSGAFPYPFGYHPAPSAPHPSVHTNPSSPSMKPVQPELRRSVHRSSNAENPSSPSLRSHSQPARPLPLGLPVQNMQPLPLNANEVFQYQQLRQHQQLINYTLDFNQNQQRNVDLFHRRQVPADLRFEDNLPKEYIGYYVHDSPPSHPYRDDLVNNRVPIYNDLQHRYRGVPANFNRLINPSRSPSPSTSLPLRDRSFSMRSASSAPAAHDRPQNPKSGYRSSGPIIVDGSVGWGLHDLPTVIDSPSLTTSRNGVASPSEDQGYDTCASTIDTPYQVQGRRGSYSYESSHSQNHNQPTPDSGRATHTSRNGIIEPLKRRATNHANDIAFAASTAKHPDYKVNGHGLGIDFETAALRQTAETERPAIKSPLPQAVPVSTVETKAEVSESRFDKQLKPLPYLSPVREVRTPSPTTNRKDDLFGESLHSGRFRGPLQLDIPPFSAVINGKQNSIHAPPQRPNGAPFSAPETLSTSQPSLTNGWQQPAKKNKKNKSKSLAYQQPLIMSGEPLPNNEAERKGG